MPTLLEAISGVANACQPITGLVTGGQPGTSQLEAMKAAGVSVILDLREPMEPRPIDEPAKVAELGMEYVNVPISAGRPERRDARAHSQGPARQRGETRSSCTAEVETGWVGR
jgi:protein tyrosine phosphatase (PTP) superfamily phosphohydrolase (DUF442 family)